MESAARCVEPGDFLKGPQGDAIVLGVPYDKERPRLGERIVVATRTGVVTTMAHLGTDVHIERGNAPPDAAVSQVVSQLRKRPGGSLDTAWRGSTAPAARTSEGVSDVREKRCLIRIRGTHMYLRVSNGDDGKPAVFGSPGMRDATPCRLRGCARGGWVIEVGEDGMSLAIALRTPYTVAVCIIIDAALFAALVLTPVLPSLQSFQTARYLFLALVFTLTYSVLSLAETFYLSVSRAALPLSLEPEKTKGWVSRQFDFRHDGRISSVVDPSHVLSMPEKGHRLMLSRDQTGVAFDLVNL